MSKLFDMFLKNRGYTEDFLKTIETSFKTDLYDIENLVDKLYYIKKSGKKLVVLPDFDMDGIMSGTLGFAGFAELGFNVELFIPDPNKGYSFNKEVIDDLVKAHPGVDAIITCDNGINSFEGVQYAKDLGLYVFITDHHKPSDTYPNADVIVDPLRFEDEYKLKGICGAHVLWQVLMKYAEKYENKQIIEQIDRLQVFAGIGTVSDMMPMLFENRELVRNAISICRLVLGIDKEQSYFVEHLNGCTPYRSAFNGLYEILRLFVDMDKIKKLEDLNEEFFGFYLAPMFNSVKRLGGNMDIAFKTFFSDRQQDYALVLYQMNENRKILLDKYMIELANQDNPYVPYIYISNAPLGFLGLIASKLTNETGLPSFVLHKDGLMYSGSGRSPEWFKANTILNAEGFDIAGHEGAFGCSFDDISEVKRLYEYLEKNIDEILESLPKNVKLTYDYVIDNGNKYGLSIDIGDFEDFIEAYNKLRPFGKDFTAPKGLLVIRGLDNYSVSFMGGRKQHAKIILDQGFEVLLWNQADLINSIDSNDLFIEGNLGLSDFMGKTTVNFMGNITQIDENNLEEINYEEYQGY